MSEVDWQRLRQAHYADAGEGIFVNHASWGLSPGASAAAMADFALRRARIDGIGFEEFGQVFERTRTALGRLVAAPAREIALAPNTTFGINLAAHLVRSTRSGGRIVLSEGEFPTNVLPWMPLRDAGFELDTVPLRDGLPDEEALIARVHEAGAVALTVSAVQFSSGYAADLERLGAACREAGVWFVVDAIQAAGVLPLEPARWGVHLLASGGQKWLCGPWGSGFCWVAPELYEHLTPAHVSWLGVEGATDFGALDGGGFRWLPDARRYEPATLAVQDCLGLAVAAELLLDLGLPVVLERIHRLHAPLLEWAAEHPAVRCITPDDPRRRAGIVALQVPDPDAVLAALMEHGIHAAVREGWLRIAPHWWVTLDEMKRVVDVLERAVPKG